VRYASVKTFWKRIHRKGSDFPRGPLIREKVVDPFCARSEDMKAKVGEAKAMIASWGVYLFLSKEGNISSGVGALVR
jgi:hypothetical protein